MTPPKALNLYGRTYVDEAGRRQELYWRDHRVDCAGSELLTPRPGKDEEVAFFWATWPGGCAKIGMGRVPRGAQVVTMQVEAMGEDIYFSRCGEMTWCTDDEDGAWTAFYEGENLGCH